MKRSKLAKKGLALVLTAAMCAQPLMVSAEEFSFQSELEDAVVTEAEPEQVEESGEAEGFEDADGFLSDDSLDEADGMTGDAAGEEEAEADGETDEFVASMDGSATGLDIDESAATVIEGTVDNAEGLTWRLDVNGVFYLDGEGELASYPRYKIEGAEADFSNYSINSLVIGSKISGTLDEDCFGAYVCQNVQNLIIKDRATGVKMELAQHGFEDRMRNLQNIVIGNGIVSLPDSTFCGCRALKNVIIPDSVETIGNSVFYGCTSLEEVIIPDSVKTCGTYIFMGCTSLKRVTLSKNVSVLSDGMFDNCVELEEVIIPDNVEEYGIDADGNGCYIFYGCKALKKVVLSKNAKIIPAGMFNGCISLKDITIPEGITAIEGGAFYNISSEANLFIPDSVTAIGYATRLPQCKVTMPCRFALENGLYRREGYSFYHMNGENDYDEDNCTVCRRTGKCGTDASYILTLGGKMTVSGTGTVSDIDYEIKEEIKTVIIEEGIYYVDDFSHCTNLESIKLADSVKILQSLQECFKLTTIITGKNLEEDIITVNCPKMENVVVSSENPNYVNKNGVVFSKDETRLVYYPSNLPGEEYIIPDTVKEISNFAFWYNQNLKKIVVPESVAALDWDGGSGYFILGNSKKLEKIILNNAAINIPLDFCYEVETLNEITIPEGTEAIGQEAFLLCRNLKTITLPVSLKKINQGAFKGCSGLAIVHYLGTENQWKEISIDEENEFLTNSNIHYCSLIQDNTTNCDYAGNRVYSCETCGSTFTVNVPKTEHEYSEWKVTRKATCSQKGELTSVCIKCGDAKHQSIEKTYHNFEWVNGEAATCEKAGLSQAEKCINCGYVERAAEIIPATGHSYMVKSQTWASCTEKGKEVDRCSNCGKEITKELPARGHQYNSSTYYPATVLAPETIVKHCSVCGNEEKTETGSKLPATISVNTTSITLKVKQSTTKVQVYNLTPGDAIKSWTSSNTKIVKVTDSGKIIAQKKTGTANVTVTLLSGKTATIKVKVQKGAVKTTKISGLKSTTLKAKKKLTLVPVIYPITSIQKVTYTSSNKKVATVSSKGVVTAKKKGKTVITVKSGSKKVSIKITVK